METRSYQGVGLKGGLGTDPVGISQLIQVYFTSNPHVKSRLIPVTSPLITVNFQTSNSHVDYMGIRPAFLMQTYMGKSRLIPMQIYTANRRLFPMFFPCKFKPSVIPAYIYMAIRRLFSISFPCKCKSRLIQVYFPCKFRRNLDVFAAYSPCTYTRQLQLYIPCISHLFPMHNYIPCNCHVYIRGNQTTFSHVIAMPV